VVEEDENVTEADRTMEERMTPEEKELFERLRAKIGEEITPLHLKRETFPTGYDEDVSLLGIQRWAIVNEDFNALWFKDDYAEKSRWQGLTAPPLYLLTIDDGVEPVIWLVRELYKPDQTLNTEKYPDFAGGLHGNNVWEFFEPIRPGDRVETRSKLAEVYWRQGRQYRLLFVTTEITYTNQKGQVVARARAGGVYRFR